MNGPDYKRAHDRVKALWGQASEHLCVDCFGPALDWALRSDVALVDPVCGKIYSDNPGDYSPLCRTCHVKSDDRAGLGRANILSFNTDPQYESKRRAHRKRTGAALNRKTRRCGGCPNIYSPGGLAIHQGASGHAGYEEVENINV